MNTYESLAIENIRDALADLDQVGNIRPKWWKVLGHAYDELQSLVEEMEEKEEKEGSE